MDTKTILATLTRLMLASMAGALVHHGVIQASGAEAFIGIGMLAATGAWGLWTNYGHDIAKASLELLRARVMDAAAKAQRNPAAAQAAVASVAAHVEATTLAAAPASPPVASVAILAIGLTLSLLGGGPAAAQQGNRAAPVARPAAPTGNPITDIGNAIRGQQQQEVAARNGSTEDLVAKLGKLALPDFEFALAMSKATGNVTSTDCWQAWVTLITAQQKPLLAADGTTVLTEPDPHLATSVEKISELLAALRPDSTVSRGCAALAAAGGKDAATLIGGILSGGALGLFKLPVIP